MKEPGQTETVQNEWNQLRGSLIINEKIIFCKESDLLVSSQTLHCTRLSPIAARALTIFSFRPFEVIRRENLVRMLWGDYGFIVTDNSLNQTICKLRENFRSIYPEQDLIKTIPRLGYSFIASVRIDARSIDQLLSLYSGTSLNANVTMIG